MRASTTFISPFLTPRRGHETLLGPPSMVMEARDAALKATNAVFGAAASPKRGHERLEMSPKTLLARLLRLAKASRTLAKASKTREDGLRTFGCPLFGLSRAPSTRTRTLQRRWEAFERLSTSWGARSCPLFTVARAFTAARIGGARSSMAGLQEQSPPKLMIRAREALDLTQTELGARLGVTKRTVARWERRSSLGSFGNLTRVATLVEKVDPSLAAEMRAIARAEADAVGLAPGERDSIGPPVPSDELRAIDLLVDTAAKSLGLTTEALQPTLHDLLEGAEAQRLTLRQLRRGLKSR